MANDTTERICNQCGNPYPLTSEYFVKDKRNPQGFMTICKSCRNANKKAWNDANPDKVKAMKKRDQEKHADRIKAQQKRWNENNQEHVSEYRKDYYSQNRERLIEAASQYQRDNRESVNSKNRAWYRANPEKSKAIGTRKRAKESHKQRVKEWAKNHPADPEHKRMLGRKWYWNNREKAIAKVHRRRNAPGSYTEIEITELYENQGGVCFYCSEPLGRDFHRDHYIPISKGGSNYIDNIVLACSPCNLSKADKLPSEWKGRLN